MRNFLYITCILLIVMVFTSCKDKEDTFDPGFDYYPVEAGNYKIYKVQLVKFTPTDTSIENFEIKELVTEVLASSGEENRYKLERYKRTNSSSPWPLTPDSIWSVTVSNSKVVKSENNVRYVKLVFPAANGRKWNGNAENDEGSDEYEIKDEGKPFMIFNQTFDKSLTVVQESGADSAFYVEKNLRKEVYAKGQGMVFRFKETFKYFQKDGQIDTRRIITDGIRYFEILSSYGKQ